MNPCARVVLSKSDQVYDQPQPERSSAPWNFVFQFVDARTNKPVQDILCDVTIFATRGNDYLLSPPLSDAQGLVAVSRQDIEDEIRRMQSFWLMDFPSGLDKCKPKILVAVPSGAEIVSCINEYRRDPMSRQVYVAQYGHELDIARLQRSANHLYLPTRIHVGASQCDVVRIPLTPLKGG